MDKQDKNYLLRGIWINRTKISYSGFYGETGQELIAPEYMNKQDKS